MATCRNDGSTMPFSVTRNTIPRLGRARLPIQMIGITVGTMTIAATRMVRL